MARSSSLVSRPISKAQVVFVADRKEGSLHEPRTQSACIEQRSILDSESRYTLKGMILVVTRTQILTVTRDRLWKSLRVLDLFLSISMGRPPSMSDIDCTVPCRALDADGLEKFDLLNASVQVLSITEDIVLQVYSRRKISLQLTEGISRQLRDWASRWLPRLKKIVAESPCEDKAETTGACQAMSSYYYAVMLVTRPFLMYELCKRLPDSTTTTDAPSTSNSDNSGRARLANACIDAASMMAESVLDLVNRQLLDGRMPLIV